VSFFHDRVKDGKDAEAIIIPPEEISFAKLIFLTGQISSHGIFLVKHRRMCFIDI